MESTRAPEYIIYSTKTLKHQVPRGEQHGCFFVCDKIDAVCDNHVELTDRGLNLGGQGMLQPHADAKLEHYLMCHTLWSILDEVCFGNLMPNLFARINFVNPSTVQCIL